MNCWWLGTIAAGVFASALGFAQQTAVPSPGSLRFENGVIANGVYSNECLGFSFAIPTGWEPIVGADGRAKHVPAGLVLLVLQQTGTKPPGKTIPLFAADASRSSATLQSLVSNMVHKYVNDHPTDRELIRDAFAVDYGGNPFFRADATQPMGAREKAYLAFLYTRSRGYLIGGSLVGTSPEELDKLADAFRGMSFQEDRVNPNCSMGNDDPPMPGGVIGGIIGSTPATSATPRTPPQRVRVSQGVSTGMLLKKVPPLYPEDARQARIQGTVVLSAVIDKNGDVANLTLVSGHPLLAPAAIEAVKQWKYKPYLLQGEPVNVETQITVNFELTEH